MNGYMFIHPDNTYFSFNLMNDDGDLRGIHDTKSSWGFQIYETVDDLVKAFIPSQDLQIAIVEGLVKTNEGYSKINIKAVIKANEIGCLIFDELNAFMWALAGMDVDLMRSRMKSVNAMLMWITGFGGSDDLKSRMIEKGTSKDHELWNAFAKTHKIEIK